MSLPVGAIHLVLSCTAFFKMYNYDFNLIYSLEANAFKDVYHSGDGGLYSEMVQNRAFQGTVVNQNSAMAAPKDRSKHFSTGIQAVQIH